MSKTKDPNYEARKQAVLDQVTRYQEFAVLDQLTQQKLYDQKFRNLVSVAVKSSWWQHRILNAKLSTVDSVTTKLSKLPVLTRSDIQQYGNWMKVWLPNSQPQQYQTIRTSGSTGKPVSLLKYLPGHTIEHLAIQLLDSIWQQRDMAAPFAQLRVNATDSQSQLPQEPFCYLGETGINYVRQLSNATIKQTLAFLAENQIKNVLVNPIALRLLANQQLNDPVSGLVIDQILSWGDKLDQSIRDLAESAFAAKVCDRYSCEEAGYLAIQCPHAEHLHVLPNYNYIELLNEKNEPCQVGELGRVVVTSWHSFGMPLIRYEIGDLAAWGEPCEYGITLPVLEPTIVRIRDIQQDDAGRIVLPRIEKTALTQIPAISDFQIVEFADGVVALVRTFADLSEAEINQIKTDLAIQFSTADRIEVLSSTDLDWLAIWKRKLITRLKTAIPNPLTLHAMQQLLINPTEGELNVQ